MSAICNWNKVVMDYREASLNHGNHWQGEHARWYDDWVKLNNYAEEIYPVFQPFVHGRVLEIGAGTGLFSQYLINDADHLDVLEPSADMLGYLQKNVGNQHKQTYYKTNIEQFDFFGKEYGFVFAAHAFFNVLYIDRIIRDILNHSQCLGVLIGGGNPLDVFRVFHNEGLVEPERAHPPHHMDLTPVLDDCGFFYDICRKESITKHVYKNEKELLEKTAKQCAIRADAMGAYQEIVKPLINYSENGVYLQGNREHICLVIGKEEVSFINHNPAK